MKRLISIASMLLIAGQVLAGGRIETLDFTGTPSPLPGFETVGIVKTFWDDRCVNVNYVVDNVPANAGQPNQIAPARIRQELQASFNRWSNYSPPNRCSS